MLRKHLRTAVALALASMAVSAVEAAPVGKLGDVRSMIDQTPVELAQVYTWGGYRYCFYWDGWQGPGWYRCGYAWRRGYGWGGGPGWRGWGHKPHPKWGPKGPPKNFGPKGPPKIIGPGPKGPGFQKGPGSFQKGPVFQKGPGGFQKGPALKKG
jgi:hypothetical protein